MHGKHGAPEIKQLPQPTVCMSYNTRVHEAHPTVSIKVVLEMWAVVLQTRAYSVSVQVCCVHALWGLFHLFTTHHTSSSSHIQTVWRRTAPSARDKHHWMWKCSIHMRKTTQLWSWLPRVQWHQQGHQLECTLTINPLSLDTHIVCSDSVQWGWSHIAYTTSCGPLFVWACTDVCRKPTLGWVMTARLKGR